MSFSVTGKNKSHFVIRRGFSVNVGRPWSPYLHIKPTHPGGPPPGYSYLVLLNKTHQKAVAPMAMEEAPAGGKLRLFDGL